MRLIVVFKDRGQENAGKLLDLLPDGVSHLMSTSAWGDYDSPGSPYFAYLDGHSGRVQSEGSTLSWDRVWSMIEDASQALAPLPGDSTSPSGGRELSLTTSANPKVYGESTRDRFQRAEDALRNAGVEPGDPSLWAASENSSPDLAGDQP